MEDCFLVCMSYDNRGDYDDMFDATEEEVVPYFEKVEKFIKDMESLITHK